MPLTNVRDLVKHASRHRYMVASFKVHGAEEVQAVVAAAEAGRAPAILAIETPGAALLDHDIVIRIAETVAVRANVPVAIEVVANIDGYGTAGPEWFVQARVPADQNPPLETALFCEAMHGVEEGADADLELFLPLKMAPAQSEPNSPWANIDRIGIAFAQGDRGVLRPGVVRKHLQALMERFDGAVVIDGDLAWPKGSFHVLPQMGIAKVNFDRRLRQAMTKAHRQVAKNREDDYRCAMTHMAAALISEVSDCLRRTGGTGRAADVTACVLSEPEKNAGSNNAPIHRPARRYHVSGGIAWRDAGTRRPAIENAGHLLHVR